jgi:hypothetical protein
MKKFKFVAVVISAFLLTFISCPSPLLDGPSVPSGGGGDQIPVPSSVTASHGERRGITVSWNENPNAALFNIYRASTPLDEFVRCGETSASQFTFIVPPGSTVFYRVSAVSRSGRESGQSAYVKGTSLAQPFISDITGITESSAAVTWYMDNVSDDTYKKDLLYTIYCFNGSTEVAQIVLDGSKISDNRAVFNGLFANTNYEYQVEAYLRSDQNISEKSDKMDAATARRFRPGQPDRFRAARGKAVNNIELSFQLPDMVDIALGDNLYDPKPVYFVISRRIHNPGGNNEFLPVCSYFGSIAAKAAKPGDSFSSYVPGAEVKWIDASIPRRGTEYEYQVQSYVDDTPKQISSDTSKANAVGWALGTGTLDFGEIQYTMHESDDAFVSAKLPLDFRFDPKGEQYDYVLKEIIEPIDSPRDPLDPDTTIEKSTSFSAYKAAHLREMDLTRKTDNGNSGRGVYSYAIEIRLGSETLDTVATIGQVEVSENTQPIVVEEFHVEDGYTNKFILKWPHHSNRKYILYESENRTGPWTEIDEVNKHPGPDDGATVDRDYTFTASGYVAGTTRYFAIKPFRDIGSGTFKPGQMVYASAASQTLGVPKLQPVTDRSYRTVTASWTEAQKADTYRIKYRYGDSGAYTIMPEIKKDALVDDGLGHFKYEFMPNGYNNVAQSGLEIQIEVDALNKGLQAAAGIGEISTTSNNVNTRLVGPALLGLSASKAGSAMEIDVSWNRIEGADGYYVFRRQFNMTNTAEHGTEAIVYYIPASTSSEITVTGKNMALDTSNAKIDTTTVKAVAAFAGSRYTLTELNFPDVEYDGVLYNRHTPAYRNQQNDMVQGYPYRYYVVPVLNRDGSPEPLNSINFTYTTGSGNIASYTLQEKGVNITYSGAAALEQTGFTVGFGQNVTATKGTYASSGNVNNGIRITWSPPPLLAGVQSFVPHYTVYRKVQGDAWRSITDVSALAYTETDAALRGKAIEYAIGISNGGSGNSSEPHNSRRFVDLCYTQHDEKNRPNMLGYMLEMVRMNSVSRDQRGTSPNFGENVTWYNEGIKNSYSTETNWGIDGYTVYVMNRNISAGWHTIYDNISPSSQTNQSILLTTGNTPSVTITDDFGNFTRNLLFVLRDYKHFFKVRSYVKNDSGEKIYCPDPPWTYPAQWNSTQFESDHVKWGARQITQDEFVQIAMLYIARGLAKGNGNAGNNGVGGSNDRWGWHNTSYGDAVARTTYGGSGRMEIWSSGFFDIPRWWVFTFNNYKDDLQTRAGDWVTFITINGQVGAEQQLSSEEPRFFDRSGYNFVSIIGPADTPGLYSGGIIMGEGTAATRISWTNTGTVRVIYPGTAPYPNVQSKPMPTGTQRLNYNGPQTPLPFHQQGPAPRFQHSQWR